MSTEHTPEPWAGQIDRLLLANSELRAQRDELAEALREIGEHGQALPGYSCDWGPEKMASVARAALAKVQS